MLKLNAGVSRKIGEPNYGSRGASVNVELELESNLIGDPDGLLNRIRGLFNLARKSVDEELNGSPQPVPQNRTAPDNGQRQGRSATASQVRAIRAICQRQGIDPDRLSNERYGVGAVDELTLPEASALIDELKSAPNGGRNGGGR